MLGWSAISSVLDLQSVWLIPNLLGSTLVGRPALHRGFGWVTVSGLGLHLFVSGLVGTLFGLAVGDSRNRVRVLLLGVITGLVWFYFSQILFWRKLGALIVIYSPPTKLLTGHLLFGSVLGCYPAGLNALRRNFMRISEAPAATPETARARDAVE